MVESRMKVCKKISNSIFYPQSDSTIQPKAQGLLHMEREFIARHIKEENSEREHLIASKQSIKALEDYSTELTKH